VRLQIICPKCRGSGAENDNDVVRCSSCGGQGVKLSRRSLGPGFVQQFQTTCEVCNGKGTVSRTKCSKCQGHKVVASERVLDVTVDPGMSDGNTIEFPDAGDEFADKPAGFFCVWFYKFVFSLSLSLSINRAEKQSQEKGG